MPHPRIIDTLPTITYTPANAALLAHYAAHGDLALSIAFAVADHIGTIEDLDAEPRPRDERAMLELIADDPAAASLGCIENVLHWLMPPCVRRYGTQDIDGLLPEQLAQCARDALLTLPQGKGGRPRRALMHKRMLRRLLDLVPDWTKEAQDELMVRALHECKVRGTHEWLRGLRGDRDSYTIAEYLRDARAMSIDEANRL